MEDFLYALRDFDGIGYYLTAILCVVLIMAIIGFLMERVRLREEHLLLAKEDEISKKKENVTSTLTDLHMQSDIRSVLDNSVTPVNGIIDFTVHSNSSMTNTNTSSNTSSATTATSVENVEEDVLNSETLPVLELNSSDYEKNNISSSDIK